ncbi:MAG TPA: YqzE family protein [Bacillota bacterium]|nr:YqzE family protein [Bacillota bacterium]
MSRNEYIQFLTKELFTYINLPTADRKKRKKVQKKKRNQLIYHRWLGMLPFSIKLFLKQSK